MLFEANGEPLLTCGLRTRPLRLRTDPAESRSRRGRADAGVRVTTRDPRLESRGNSGNGVRSLLSVVSVVKSSLFLSGIGPLLTCGLLTHVRRHPVATGSDRTPLRKRYAAAREPRTSTMALPISAGEFTTRMPASSRAFIFSEAVPLPPEMIAPA